MRKKNVSKVAESNLCCSCGVCKGACNKDAISFLYGKEINIPVVDNSLCVDCGVCYDICPGKGIDIRLASDAIFSPEQNVAYNALCGYYVGAYASHSADKEIRYHSASGGTVTSFLCYLLREGIVDGLVVTRYQKDNPIEPEPFIATTEQEILSTRGSKYLVLSYDRVIEQVKLFHGTVAIVGLPCQIQGFRMLAEKNRRVREKVKGYFAIYCSLTKTKHSMGYYLWRYGLKENEIGYFSFRDDGCLGYMKVEDKKGNLLKKVKYEKYWHGTHSFFVNGRCSVCIDHFGELADISFGDIHVEPYSADTIGLNSVITRSTEWDAILRKCSETAVIDLKAIPIDDVLRSQPYAKIYKKGAGVVANFNLRKLAGMSNPDYGGVCSTAKPKIKNYIQESLKGVMRSMGHHRIFWPVIKFLDR